VVLVTVKSADTAGMADIIAGMRCDAVVVSLQNGNRQCRVLRERIAGASLLAGMVRFNVISAGEGRGSPLHPRATSLSNRTTPARGAAFVAA